MNEISPWQEDTMIVATCWRRPVPELVAGDHQMVLISVQTRGSIILGPRSLAYTDIRVASGSFPLIT